MCVCVSTLRYDAHLLKRQQEILNQICNVGKASNVDKDLAGEILTFLLRHAFFEFSASGRANPLDLPAGSKKATLEGLRSAPIALSKCVVHSPSLPLSPSRLFPSKRPKHHKHCI